MGPQDIRPHEYLISLTENKCKLAWFLTDMNKAMQFTLLSMGLISYSRDHISGHHEPIHAKFAVWGFLIMFY